MAGAGYKLFNTGDVLTAAQVNTYLQEQTVMVFADATARTTALSGVLAEGMVTYLKDTNAIEKYTGAAWVNIDSGSTSPLTTKGDLYTYSTADARLAVGNNGDTLVADSSATTGLRWQGNFAAGKNAIINGDMQIWQRGTSISLTNNTTAFGPDRFNVYTSFSAGSSSFSQQSFTAGTAPVAGYESAFFARLTCGSTATYFELNQAIEDVRKFAGQTVTFSFWAKASASIVILPQFNQRFGSGGSSTVSTNGSNQTLTTSWARYSVTVSLPSISGKTLGAGNYLNASLVYVSGTLNSATIDIWGWQVEAGNTATAFQTATGTLAGELAACQRYYVRLGANSVNAGTSDIYAFLGNGFLLSNTLAYINCPLPVNMRGIPTSVDYSTVQLRDVNNNQFTATIVLDSNFRSANSLAVQATITGGTATRYVVLTSGNSSSGYIAASAEL